MLGRLKDVLTSKGPDIYVGDRYRTAPHRPDWSNWTEYGNLDYHNQWEGVPGWIGDEDVHRVYDFRTRRYKKHRSPGLWSDAKRDPQGQHDLWYFRTAQGQPIPVQGDWETFLYGNPYANWDGYPNHGHASRWAYWVPDWAQYPGRAWGPHIRQ